MKPISSDFSSIGALLFCVIQIAGEVVAGTQFTSHVSINTPARSFSHGVGDPLALLSRRTYQQQRSPFRQSRRPIAPQTQGGGRGYPREKPSTPFQNEEIPRDNSFNVLPWRYNSYMTEVNIPVLPLSPYKVDSPDPESLWPDGLFVAPINPPRFEAQRRSLDSDDIHGLDLLDPYLLQGSEAIAAVKKSNLHGHLYFHDIPHVKSLLENQELRTKNKLKPHRLGSIRHTWPYNRP